MNSAFLIIDVQNFYFPSADGDGLYRANETKDVIKDLIAKFRAKQIPIIYVQHVSTEFVEENPVLDVCEEIHKDILPLEGDTIIYKKRPSSFYHTKLQETLTKMGVTDLYICGMMSHMCVDTTVRAARDLEYNVTLFDDACTTRNLDWNGENISADLVHKAYMASLKSFANVIFSEDFN